MATERLTMRKIREILRHKWALGRSHRDVAASLSVSVGAVSAAEQRARRVGLDWGTVESLSDAALEIRLYGALPSDRHRSRCARSSWHSGLRTTRSPKSPPPSRSPTGWIATLCDGRANENRHSSLQ